MEGAPDEQDQRPVLPLQASQRARGDAKDRVESVHRVPVRLVRGRRRRAPAHGPVHRRRVAREDPRGHELQRGGRRGTRSIRAPHRRAVPLARDHLPRHQTRQLPLRATRGREPAQGDRLWPGGFDQARRAARAALRHPELHGPRGHQPQLRRGSRRVVVRRGGVPARHRPFAVRGQGEPATQREGGVSRDSRGPDRLSVRAVAPVERGVQGSGDEDDGSRSREANHRESRAAPPVAAADGGGGEAAHRRASRGAVAEVQHVRFAEAQRAPSPGGSAQGERLGGWRRRRGEWDGREVCRRGGGRGARAHRPVPRALRPPGHLRGQARGARGARGGAA